jgi:hypothetical protein
MYGLPEHIEALPPMPEDGHHWSSLHNWVMPTPSFLEFVMFSRMFSESLDALHNNLNDSKSCSLASSLLEVKISDSYFLTLFSDIHKYLIVMILFPTIIRESIVTAGFWNCWLMSGHIIAGERWCT